MKVLSVICLLIVLGLAYHNKGCAATERESLVIFYKSLKGSSWTKPWPIADAEKSHCQWPGVICNSAGKVTHLHLADNNLRGTLPKTTYCYKYLQTLDLNKNSIAGSILDQPNEGITKLKFLKVLGLGHNRLQGAIPEGLCKLHDSLQYLVLENNFISGSIPECFDERFTHSLKTFNVKCNRLSGSIPIGFKNMEALRSLWINCQVPGFTPCCCPLYELPAHIDLKCGDLKCEEKCDSK
ncbi:hypothetical protein GEMRC1_003687 [Eukaryota sp. GEM-RC1]